MSTTPPQRGWRGSLFLLTPFRFETAPLAPKAAVRDMGTAVGQRWQAAARQEGWTLSAGYVTAGQLLERRIGEVPALRNMPWFKADSPIVDDRLWALDRQGPSHDLHPFIRRLLGAVSDMDERHDARLASDPALLDLALRHQGTFRELPTLELPASAVNLLNGGFGRGGRGLALTLGAASSRRLGSVAEKRVTVTLQVNDVRLQLFGTGWAGLTVELDCGAEDEAIDPAACMQETLHLLGHHRRQSKPGQWHWLEATEAECPGLQDLLEALIEGTGLTAAQTSRGFTYSCLRLPARLEQRAMHAAGTRLACRFTSDYAVEGGQLTLTEFKPFSNVLHTMAGEGGSLIVTGTEDVEFLRGFADRVRRVYYPLALLAHHEQQVLLDMSQEMLGFDVYRSEDAEVATRVRELHRRLVQFHLEYRFSVASLVTLHNKVHLAWRQALDLDRLLAEASSDVAEGEKILADQVRRSSARRTATWDALAAAVGAFLVCLQLTTSVSSHVFDGNAKETMVLLQGTVLVGEQRQAAVERFLALEASRGQWERAGAGLSLFAALVAGSIVWRVGRERVNNA